MAWALEHSGNSAISKSFSTSWNPFTTSGAAADTVLVYWIVSDNTGVGAPTWSISKASGETNDWVTLGFHSWEDSSPSAGYVMQILAIDCSVSWELTNPTLTPSAGVTAKVVAYRVFSGGSVADAETAVIGTPASGQTATITDILNGDLTLALTGAEGSFTAIGEGNTNGFVTGVARTTGGTSLGNISMGFDYKLHSADDDSDSYSPDAPFGSSVMAVLMRQPAAAEPNEGTASGTTDFTGSATGSHPPNEGSASGTVDLTGSATGAQPPSEGTATGSVDLAGSATGEHSPAGSASGSVDLAGTAAGSADRAGSASGTVDYAGSATGDIAANSGGVAGSLVFHAGSVVGQHPTPLGQASGSVTFTPISATGEHSAEGSTTGSVNFSGAASGVVDPQGQASASVALAGSAAGENDREGDASGTVDLTGSATGETPAISDWSLVSSGAMAQSKTSSTSFQITGSVHFPGAAGDALIVWIAADNSSTDASPSWTLSRPVGETNTWTYLQYSYEAATTAGSGVTLHLYGIDTTVSWSGHTLVATASTAVSAKVGAYSVFTGGSVANMVPSLTRGGYSTGSLDRTFAGLYAPAVGDVLLAAVAAETSTTTGLGDGSPPMDSTGALATSGGSSITNIALAREFWVVDAAGDFTYSPSLPVGSPDAASVAVLLKRSTAPRGGAGSGSLAFSGSATGDSASSGSASGTLDLAGSATGDTPDNTGAASGAVAYTGTLSGTTDYRGTASGSVISTGTASGTAPLVAGSSGGASGSLSYTGTSSGTRVGKGSAVGYVSATGQVSGVTTRDGYAVGTTSYVATLVRGGARGIVDATVVVYGPTRHALDVDQRPRRTLIFSGVGGHAFDPSQSPRHNFRPGRPDRNALDVEGART